MTRSASLVLAGITLLYSYIVFLQKKMKKRKRIEKWAEITRKKNENSVWELKPKEENMFDSIYDTFSDTVFCMLKVITNAWFCIYKFSIYYFFNKGSKKKCYLIK